jgi:hypothetical protein
LVFNNQCNNEIIHIHGIRATFSSLVSRYGYHLLCSF